MLLTTQLIVLLLLRCSSVNSGVVTGLQSLRYEDSSDEDTQHADDSVTVSQGDDGESQTEPETQILEESPHTDETQILEGRGDDTQILEDSSHRGETQILEDRGDDTQILEDSSHRGETQILEGRGDDTQILEDSPHRGETQILEGRGDDTQILEGRGDDTQILEDSPHRGETQILEGRGDDTQILEDNPHTDETQISEGSDATQILEDRGDDNLKDSQHGDETQILQNIPNDESQVFQTTTEVILSQNNDIEPEQPQNNDETFIEVTTQTYTQNEENTEDVKSTDVQSSSNNQPDDETQSLLGNQEENRVGEEEALQIQQEAGSRDVFTQYTPIVHEGAEHRATEQTSQDNEEVTSQPDSEDNVQILQNVTQQNKQTGSLVVEGSRYQEDQRVYNVDTDTEQHSSNIADEVHTEEEARRPVSGDYVSALRDLSEAVRSLLPLREHMAVAMECQEGREAVMHNVISEMRGRMVQLEQQLSSAREAERECHMEAQAVRALGLEARLAECKGRLEERQSPQAIIRVEMLTRKYEEADEDRESVSLQQLVTLFENEGSQLVKLVSGLETKMTDIHTISRETLKFVESVQESESEDSVQSEELTRLTTMINASEATIASLRLELENSEGKLKAECRANLTQAEKECSSSVMATAAAARAQCAAESARLQGERLGYIVGLHAEHNATLTAAQESCRQELEALKVQSLAECEASTASQLAAKEAECSEECRAHAVEIRDDATQEQNVTLAAVQANCDDALAALQERCDAELRLHLHPDIDVRINQQRKSKCAVQTIAEDPLTSMRCQGYNKPYSNTTFIEPEVNEVSVRLGNHLYIISNQRVDDFATAWSTCRERGMWLLALETLEEQTELVSRVQLLLAGAEEEEHSLWTSAQRDVHSSWFRWQCGDWVTPWAAQRIDSDDACLALAFPQQIGGRIEWRDVSCDQPQQLACEVALRDEE